MYDLLIYIAVALLLLILYRGPDQLTNIGVMQQTGISFVSIFAVRLIGNIYGQIWRYGGIQCYVKILCTDAVAFVLYLGLELSLPVEKITFARLLCLSCLNLLGALTLRMMYRYAYKCGNQETRKGRFWAKVLDIVAGVKAENVKEVQKIKIAIIGAGRVGVSFAEELLNNESSSYVPRCFIDTSEAKREEKFTEFRYGRKMKLHLPDWGNSKYRRLFLRFRPWQQTSEKHCTSIIKMQDIS